MIDRIQIERRNDKRPRRFGIEGADKQRLRWLHFHRLFLLGANIHQQPLGSEVTHLYDADEAETEAHSQQPAHGSCN